MCLRLLLNALSKDSCWFLFFLCQIKALISAPATESTSSEAKKPAEDPAVAKKMPAAEPAPTAAAAPTAPTTPAPTPKPEVSTISKALGLLGKRTFEK